MQFMCPWQLEPLPGASLPSVHLDIPSVSSNSSLELFPKTGISLCLSNPVYITLHMTEKNVPPPSRFHPPVLVAPPVAI